MPGAEAVKGLKVLKKIMKKTSMKKLKLIFKGRGMKSKTMASHSSDGP